MSEEKKKKFRFLVELREGGTREMKIAECRLRKDVGYALFHLHEDLQRKITKKNVGGKMVDVWVQRYAPEEYRVLAACMHGMTGQNMGMLTYDNLYLMGNPKNVAKQASGHFTLRDLELHERSEPWIAMFLEGKVAV